MELENEQIASLLFDGFIESIFPEGVPESRETSVQDTSAKKDFRLDGAIKSKTVPKDIQETPTDVPVDPSKINRTAVKESVAELIKIADLLIVPQRAKKTKEDYAAEVDDLLSTTLNVRYQAFKSFLDSLFEPLSVNESHAIVLYLIQTLGPKYGAQLVLNCRRYYKQTYQDVTAKLYKEKTQGSSV
ncbi:uncharacterized protein LOC135687045 [Rhopilema esculentum]|uniref:uncharacterized protein LOC135687045 n=1 Tax=Rhopilema esculentum TaxID=499914 RepID=UPI0031DA74E1